MEDLTLREIKLTLEDILGLDKIKFVNCCITRIDNTISMNKALIDKYFQKTQPKSIEIKYDVIKGGKRSNVIEDYMINAEEPINENNALEDLKKIYTEFLNQEYKRIADLKQNDLLKQLIVYLADDLKMDFINIADIVGYTIRHTYRLYKEEKDVIDLSQREC